MSKAFFSWNEEKHTRTCCHATNDVCVTGKQEAMIFGSQSHDQYPQEFDQHNATTEPLISPHQPSYPASPVYPVLPPLPASAKNKKWRQPAGGAPHVPYISSVPPVSPYYPVTPPNPVQKTRTKPRVFPSLVGLFFVAVQLLLLVRFILKFIGLGDNVSWVVIVYSVSNIFVLPFRFIIQNITLPIPSSIELYTLLAILIYGVLARILVPILKAMLR